ncbi:MAG: tetratricopeptide repeat protein, partial [Candidatus Omnitrophota bacterium]
MNKPQTSFLQKTALMLLGLILTIMILEAGLRLGGFVLTSIQEHRNRVAISRKGSYRIMCLGESTTAMQYPPYLEEILKQSSSGIKFSVIDKGVSGTVTDTIVLYSLESNLDTYRPDMVITMMGINDNGPHMPYESPSDSKVINFLKSCRTYKLARLLWLHLTTKLQELGWLKPLPQQDRERKIENIQDYESLSTHQKLIRQGNSYRMQRKYAEAEKTYKKVIGLDPRNDEAYYELGDTYREVTKYPEAEEACKRAVEINPKNYDAYRELGDAYRYQGRSGEAETAYRTAIELNPQDFRAYPKLGTLYQQQKRYSEALELFERFIRFYPESPQIDRAYGASEGVYRDMGDLKLAEKYRDKTKQMRLGYINPKTRDNYLKLREILRRRGIMYVCAQYPMRDVESLKKIFANDTENIVFVDNEKLFKEAVQKDGWAEYFRDMIGGDFG